MPLESHQDYVRLNDHLLEIDSRLADFAAAHGYVYQRPLEGGLYPRLSLTKYDAVTRSIQLTMDLNERGEMYDRFFPEIPYTIFAAAWIDDETELTRLRGPSIRIERMPFVQFVAHLDAHLGFFMRYVESIDESYLRSSNLVSFMGDRLTQQFSSD